MINKKLFTHQVKIHLALIFTSFLLIVVPVLNKTPSQHVAEQSISAASQFLFLVDTEEYAKSWDVASDALKSILSKQVWHDEITRLRSLLGPILERVEHDIAYTSYAKDVPEGEYVVMTFVSRFALKERVIETVTLMLGDNNEWQVAGYHFKVA
jgi:aspartokinase-like uncharacterized kinase